MQHIPTYMKNRLQKVQNTTAGFVLNKYTKMKDVLELKLLTTEERIELSTLIFSLKGLLDQQFPQNLQLQQKQINVLRNKNYEILMEVFKNSGTFAKQCARSCNDLPIIIWSDVALSSYKVTVKQYLVKTLAKFFME